MNYKNIIPLKNAKRNKKKLKSYWIFKLIRNNGIGADGAGKLGEGVSKLLNLTTLNLNFE